MPVDLPLSDQKAMRAFVDRRHPAFNQHFPHWQFCESTFEGGRDWFTDNIHPYLKEGEREYTERLRRAYRFNHTKEVISLVTKYIFKDGIIRNTEDAADELKSFWKHATLDGADIDSLMRQVSVLSSGVGRVWVAIDNRQADEALTVADAKNGGSRIYAYIVKQQDVLDFARDEMGELSWVLYRLKHRDDIDPVASSGSVMTRYMLWTRDEWVLLEEREKPAGPTKPIISLVHGTATSTLASPRSDGDNREIVLISRGENALGEVPMVPCDNAENHEPYAPPGLVDDIAYLDRAVANYLSNLDAIIQDQTFSQLAMPAQGMLPGEDTYAKMVEMGTKRIFLYDGESGKEPVYISPDASQAELIISVIKTIINEIYHSVGLAGERTKADNAMGIDNSSGVAKAYDFDRMNALLAAKADMLDRAEQRIAHFVLRYAGHRDDSFSAYEDDQADEDLADGLIKYPDNFDTRGLPDEFDIADNLSLLEAPPSARRYQMDVLLTKMFPRLAVDIKKQIQADLKDWPVDPMEKAAEMATLTTKLGQQPGGSIQKPIGANPNTPAAPAKSDVSGPKPRGASKQGQNPGKSKRVRDK
jgi:hypothetical protein